MLTLGKVLSVVFILSSILPETTEGLPVCRQEIDEYGNIAPYPCEPIPYIDPDIFRPSCSSSSECESNTICLSGKCSCQTYQYYDFARSTCESRKARNEPCTNPDQCQASLTCIYGTCDCSSTQYYDSGCKTRMSINEHCISTDQCLASLTCMTGTCDCTNSQYYDSGCKDRLGHTESCPPSVANACEDADVQCIPDKFGQERCLCSSDMHYRRGVCQSLGEFKVVISPPIERYTTSVNFTWTADDYGLSVTYKIKWKSLEHHMDMGELSANEQGGLVSDLTPGREYNFTILSILAPDNFYEEKSTESLQTLETLPERPGPVIAADVDGSSFVIRFQPSKGDVSSYKVTLSDGGLEKSLEADKPEVQFPEIRPDTEYSYMIVATNKQGDVSEIVTGSFKTGAPTPNVGLIAGVVVAAVVVVVAVCSLVTCLVLRRRRVRANQANVNNTGTGSSNSEGGSGDSVHENTKQEENVMDSGYWSYCNWSPADNIYDEIHEDDEDGVDCNMQPQDHTYMNIAAEAGENGKARYVNVLMTRGGDDVINTELGTSEAEI